ncbi:MAG: penicillin-binding protein 2 [Lentisphaeria bacterium]|nr:penicillin-binding protein 2 [Lentisphaeria bacterium]
MSSVSSTCVHTRIKLVLFFLAIVAIGLIARFFYIQVVRHNYYLEVARNIYNHKEEVHGKWGEIFDMDGNLLVGNMPCVIVKCAPCNIKEKRQRQQLAQLASEHFGKSYDYFYKRLAPEVSRYNSKTGKYEMRDNQYCLLAKYADMYNVEMFRKRLVPIFQTEKERNRGKKTAAVLSGRNLIAFDYVTRRIYPKGRLLSNVLGYSNLGEKDVIAPQEGLERRMHQAMAPVTGTESYDRDPSGRRLVYGENKIVKPSHDGKNVYLTIKEPIQSIVEEELDAAVAKWNPHAAYAVVADPKTGNILAIAQRPTFDPNNRKSYKRGAITSRIAMDIYEPGSVMKPFVIGKALDWKVITPETEFFCENNAWHYAGWKLSDTRDYGTLDTTGVIRKSSNIGTAKVAVMLGAERTYNVYKMFGFGTPTDLPLPAESVGRFTHYKKWEPVQITRVPIGYTMSATLLQITRAYCALANGGKMPQLRLIDRTEKLDGTERRVMPYAPQVALFERKEAYDQLVDMMVAVTSPGGTATRAAIPGYKVAGKTGTSRKGYSKRGFSGNYYTSFAGFVPAKSPEIVMVIMVDSPKGNRPGGGSVAAPIFAASASRILDYLNIPADPELLPKNKRAGR